MAAALVGSPNVELLTVVPQPVIVAWLRALVASKRRSMLRRSPIRKTRLKEPLSENTIGPGMVSRPASPHRPAAGAAKALVLKPSPGVAGDSGRPVASARTLPLIPVPVVVARLPALMAVRGEPVRRVIPFWNVQSLSRAPLKPFTRVPPLVPTEVLYCHCAFSVCRASKEDSPRSAVRYCQFCATTAPP